MKKIFLLFVVCSLTTFYSFSQVVFSESFSAGSLPSGWSSASVSPNDAWAFGGFVDFGSSAVRPDAKGNLGEYARLDFSLDPDTTSLITPAIYVGGLTNPRLVFSYITQTTNTSFSPYNRFIVDYWNGSSWINITVIDTLTPAGWTEYKFNVTTFKYSTDSVKFRFSGQEGGAAIGGSGTATFDQDMAFDDVIVEQTPTCIKPTVLFSANITAFTADLNWTNNATSSVNYVEYGPEGFALGTGITTTDTVNSRSLTGLSSNTKYDWYVRSFCTVGDTSTFAGPSKFTTFCSSFSAPYLMDMEGEAQDVPPSCWTEYETYPNGFVEVEDFTGTSSPFAGTQALYIYSSSGFSAGSDTLMAISPQFSDMTAGDKRVRFQANSDLVSQLVIGTMSAPGPSGTFTPLDTTAFAVADTYEEVVVDLTTANGYNGTDQYVALMHDLGGTFDYIRIDNFNYELIPTCAPRPSATATGGVTASAATLSWTNTSGSSLTQVEYGTAGFVLGTGTQITDTLSPKMISGLTDNTLYDWYVRIICTVGDTSVWSDKTTFITQCLPFTAPYFMDMEGQAQDAPPQCWKEYETYPNGFVEVEDFTGTSSPFAGTQALYIYSSSGFSAGSDTLMAISPAFSDMTAGDKRVRFQANSDLVSQLVIGTMSAPDPSGTFTPIDTTAFAVADTYEEIIVNLTTANGYNGTDLYIGLMHDLGGAFDYIRIDDFRYEAIPSCPAPISLAASNITSDSASLSWADGGTATTWELEWGPAGFTQGAAPNSAVISTTPSFVIGGLTAASAYEWNVRAICGSNDSSGWSGPGSFTTAIQGPVGFTCTTGNPSVVFSDEMDAQGSWTGNIGTGNRLWRFNSGGTSSGGTGPLGSHSGTGYAYFESSSGSPTVASMVSPAIDLSAGNNFAELSFWYHAFGNSIGTLDVGVSTSAAGPFTNLWTYSGQVQANQADPWQQVGINLDAYVGSTIYLEYTYTMNGTAFTQDVAVDFIEVSTCTSCAGPSNLVASNVTTSGADLGWTENGTATEWQIEYGVAGFTLGSGTLVGSTTTNPHVISGLMSGTLYDYYVRAICAVGDTSGWSLSGSFGTAYAIPYVQNFDAFPNTNISSEGWSNSRGSSVPDWTAGSSTGSSGTGPLQDHTTGSGKFVYTETSGATAGLVDTLSGPGVIFDSSQSSIELSYWYHMVGSTMGDLQVWVDTNGVWDSLTTYVGQQQAAQADPWLKGSHILTGYEGQVVKVHFLAVSGASFASDMAVDDVAMNIPPSCVEPNALMANSISTDSAVLAWTENNTATQWEIEYGLLGFTPGSGTIISVTSNPYSLTGLSSSTEYEWRVKSICGPADSSLWSSMSSFKTAFQCPAGAICATYTSGDISTDFGITYPTPSSCPGSLSLVVPAGNQIDSVSTFYDMTAAGGAWMSEQGSYLYSPTTMNFEGSSNDGAGTTAGTFSYSRDGLAFANGATGTVAIEMHAERSWGGSGCASNQNKVDDGTWTVIAYYSPTPLTPIALPITWDDGATVDLSTIDFGGNASMLTLDPMDTTNTVLQSIKGANSQVWAGTSFGDSLDMPIAFAAGTTTIRAVVYSATAGTPVLLKVEDQANGSISSEILANTVTAGGWDTLSFNLSNGNPALNFANTYNKMSIFYNFGNAPAVADTFYVDYVELSPNVAPPVPAKAAIALPITWDDTANVDYSTIDFGGNASMMTADPMNASNLVLQSVKGVGAQTWAGTTFGDSLASAIPFSTGNTTIRAVVYSPTVGIEVRLKVEDKTNPGISVESNVLTTVANGWDTLNFDMSAQSSGTAAINFANTYDKMSIFYNFGVSPTVADTFYVDFVDFANPPPAGPSIPYFEDFEAFTNGTPQQNGWSRVRTGAPNWNVDNGGTPSGATGPTIDHTAGTAAGKYVYLETSGGSLGLRDTLSSPSISVGANLNTLALDYWYHMAGSSMGQMQVWVDTNGVWDSITTYVGPQHTAIADPWLSASHIITGYGGQNVTIHFIGERGSSFTGDMAVDDISLATPPTCIAPNALVTSSIGADSAILGWTENNTVPSPGWEIEWGPLGFTPGSGTVVSVTSNPFTLTGLTTVTDYSWRVRANCTPTDSSSWSSMSSFKTAFQCPAGAICATYTAGDISSDFGFQSLPGASTCADSVTVAIPSGDRIDSITTFYTMTAGNGAWISEQNSWLYSPTVMSGEAALTDGPAVNTAGTGSYSRAGLTFANGATGSVVIQMHAGRDWGGTGCDPSYNKVDSASWTVIAYHSAIPSCLEPISVTGTAVSTDSATVAWSDTNTVMAPSYDLSYGTAGTAAGAGTVITVTGSTAGIGGLMPGTAYDVYVRANCGVGNSSPWSAVASFATFNGVPYTQNFEAFANGSPSSEGWFNTASTNPQWLVDAGGTPSGGTGPIVDHTVGTATGKYVFLETSVPGVAGDADTMVSAPIFVDASQSILELAFWYHFHGATVGSMEAWIIDSSGTPNLVGTIVGQQQPVQTDPWLRAKFVASGYQGQSIRLAFVGIRGTSFTGDIAIDDVSLDLPPAAEVGITDILRPSSGCGLGADSVEVEITNFGANAQTGFSIGYSLNGVAITPETVAASLGAGMTMNYTFSTTAAIGTAGNYDLVTYTMLVGDADASNDTLGTSVTSFATVSAFPYATSFETGNDSWFATGDASWELGTPTGFVIDTASNGTQAWVTDLDANYGDGLNSFLTSPCFDFTSVANPAINLDIWYDIESQWDGAFLQATTDGGATWTTIGSEDDIINWYNDTSRVPVDNNYSTVGDSWTGDGSVSGVNGSNGWITASHELDGLGGQSSVQLRVVFASDANTNGDGLGVDNIEIYDRDPSYPIAILNTEDASGVADSLGVDAWTSGVVVGIDLDGNNGISFTIIDDESGVQEGMNIFNFNDVSNYVVTEGDEILVHGGIIQFNGLTELSPDSIYILSTGNAIPTPIVVTDLDETTESRWLSIPTNWVSLSTSGAFSSNVSLTNGTDTITMRIDSDTDVNDSLTSSGMPIVPGDTICGLFGIGGQFDNSSPYTSGYQIFPMRWSDLTICRLSTGIESTDAIETQFELIPNPTTGEFTIRSNGFESATINVSIRDLSGRLVSSEFINNANGNFSKSFDLNGESKGVYFITIMDGENVINKKLIVQ